MIQEGLFCDAGAITGNKILSAGFVAVSSSANTVIPNISWMQREWANMLPLCSLPGATMGQDSRLDPRWKEHLYKFSANYPWLPEHSSFAKPTEWIRKDIPKNLAFDPSLVYINSTLFSCEFYINSNMLVHL